MRRTYKPHSSRGKKRVTLGIIIIISRSDLVVDCGVRDPRIEFHRHRCVRSLTATEPPPWALDTGCTPLVWRI